MEKEKLSEAGKKELEHMRKQVLAFPDDEATPTARWDHLPADEKRWIQDEYERMGGK